MNDFLLVLEGRDLCILANSKKEHFISGNELECVLDWLSLHDEVVQDRIVLDLVEAVHWL